jgi:hypothetical protein
MTYQNCLINQGYKLLTMIGGMSIGAYVVYTLSYYFNFPIEPIFLPVHIVIIFCLTYLVLGAYMEYKEHQPVMDER